MTKVIPRRKKHIIPLTVMGIILSLVLLPYVSYYEYYHSPYYHPWGIYSDNSNAKLVFTNVATYMANCEVKNIIVSDRAYCGSLTYRQSDESYYDNYQKYTLYDGSEEDVLKFMRHMMGSTDTYRSAGYFYVMIKDGKPIQSYWSNDEKLLYYKERLTSSLESGSVTGTLYMDGAVAGGYPVETVDYKTKPHGHISPLPLSIVLRENADKFLIILTICSPLIILRLISFFVHRFYTPREYKNNAQAVFEAAEVYVSECKNRLPDIVYSGVLKARKDVPHICFDGSSEDFSAFLSDIASDRCRNYYRIKIQDGIVTESRFATSRRLLKGAECGGIYPDSSGK